MLQKIKKIRNPIDSVTSMTRVKKFFRKFWAIILTGLGAIAAFFYFKKKKLTDDSTLNSTIQSAHDDFADNVSTIQDQQSSALTSEADRHKTVVEEIKNKYEGLRENLDSETQSEADKIIKENKNDPVALAKKLSEVTGFTIIMPKD